MEMKNKLVVLLTLLAVPSVAFAYDSAHKDLIQFFREWIYPIYLYNIMFGFSFAWIIVWWYCRHKTKMDNKIMRLCQYLKSHSTIAIISCGLIVGFVLGFMSRIVWIIGRDDYYSAEPYICGLLFCVTIFMILLAWGYFRNRVLLSAKFIKVTGLILISSLCANLLFLFLNIISVINIPCLRWSSLKDYGLIGEGGTQPISCIIAMWRWGIFWILAIPFSLLLLWIGNAYRWLKSKWKQRVAMKKLD